MEVIRIIKDESLIFGKTSLDISSSIDPNDVTSFVPTKVLETKEVNLGGWYVDIEATLSEKSKIEQDYILLVETKSKGVQPFRVHNKEVKKRRVLARAYHVMFDSELYVVEDYSSDKLGTLTVLNGLNDNLDRPSPYTFTVSHAGSITMDFSGMTLLEAWEHLVDNKAALVEADWYRMYFRNELGRDRGVTISHGKDLEDIVGTEDWSTVVTKIYPYTSGGVTLPEKYLMSEVQYNRPYTRRVEIAVDVDAIKEQYPEYSDEQLVPLIQEQLRSNAERHLEESQYPQVTYRVSSNVAEDLDLWDKILVKHPAITYNLPLEGPVDQEAIDRLGIPTKVLAYQYDVIAKRTVKLDYGDFYANFSKLFNSKLDKIAEEWKKVENNLEQRLDAQTELINNWNKKGHMVILENEILFLDKLPMGDADNVLRIGLGGIAFSQTGVDGNFTSAWDLEGNFNTDFIGAGQIRTNHLSSDVGSSLDLSSNESVNMIVTNKVIEEVDNIELPPGPPGQDAVQWTIGTDGYWYADGVKTNKKAIGEDGSDADIWTIGANGNWFKNGVDTGQPSKGDKGDPGEPGPRGLQGLEGPEGKQGIQGANGVDGLSSYTHIAYATSNTGDAFSHSTFSDATYIGMYVSDDKDSSEDWEDYEWTLIKGADGSQGIQGPKGNDGLTPYFHTAWANNSTGTSGFSTTDSVNKLYIGTYTDHTQADSDEPSDYDWTKIKGDKGDSGYTPIKGVDYFDGIDGQDGKGITSSVVTYQNHTNGTTAPTGTWTTSPSPIKGQYLWTRTVTTYTDTTSVPTYSVAYQAIDGASGTDGRGIVSTVVEYVKSTTATMPSTGWSTTRPTVNKGEYLWTRTTINYTSGSPSVAISNSYVPTDGQNGTSAYLWVRYSQNANGNPMTTDPVGAKYIGVATTSASTAPTGYASYSWSLVKGQDGVKGETGQDGKTSYLHIKYSNDGGLTFTSNGGETVGDWIGTYVDFTEADSNSVSSYTWNKVKGEQGPKGDTGAQGKGISSTVVTYQAGSSGTVAPTGTWSSNVPTVSENQYLWTRTIITYTDNQTSTAYSVGKMGAQGPKGDTGTDGKGISSTTVTYQASTSGTVTPTGTWQTTVPSVSENQYLWTRIVINYTTGSPTTSYSIGKMGAQGPQGAKGDTGLQGATGEKGPKGDTGTSVESVVEWYLATNLSKDVTTSTSGWTTGMQAMTTTKKYLWNYEVINFSDGSSSPTIPVIIGVYGNTGATGRALTGVTEYYLASASASGVTRPATDGTGGWTTTMQTTSVAKPYLWNYEKLAWSVSPLTSYIEPIVIGVHGATGPQGVQGPKGDSGKDGIAGKDGKGISSTTITYGLSTTDTVEPTNYTSNVPTLVKGRYLWTKTVWKYTDATTETGYTKTYIAKDGNTGKDGIAGKDGVGISKTTITYAKSTNGTTAPTTGYTTTVPSTNPGDYLWTKTVWTYTDNTNETGYSVGKIGNTGATGATGPQGPKGDRGPQGATGDRGPKGDIGTSVESVVEYYGLSTSASTEPTSWTEIVSPSTPFPQMTAINKYLWNYEKINFSDGTSQPTIPVIVGVYGDKGQPGSTGATGRSITAIQEYYLATSASTGVTRPDTDGTNGWTIAMQTTTPAKKYLWNYEKITWSSGTTTTYTNPIIIGVHGEKGEKGDDGASAKLLYLSASAEAMTFNSNNTPNPASQTITFTANLQNATGIAAFTATPYNGTTAMTAIILGGSGNTRTLTQSQFPATATRIQITATLGGLSDTVSVVKLKNGATGGTGAKGDNSIVGYLTNESVTLGASSTGVVSSFTPASGTFRVFDGITEVTTNSACVFSLNSSTGVELTINSSGVYTVNAMSADTATAEFKAVYKGVTITKSMSLSKSRVGATGSQGPQGIRGPAGANGQSQWTYIRYSANSNGSDMKTTPTSTTKYVGIAVTNSQTVPAYTAFTWSKYIGEDGSRGPQGIPGDKGEDGEPTYTWVKYADDDLGTNMSDFPQGKKYIGLAFNQTSYDESTDYEVYQWSLMPQNITVGGRNLLLNTGVEVSNGSYNIASYDLADEIEVGEEVTLTIWGELASTKTDFKAYNSGGSVRVATLTDNGNGTYSSTFKWVIGSSTNTYLNVYAFTNAQTGISTINKIKLEKGNTATDWTPAPEDAQKEIALANQRLDRVDHTIQEFTTRITDAEGNIKDQKTHYYYDSNGLTIGSDKWDSTIHINGEGINFRSKEDSDLLATFSANGMYVNKWLTDLHAIEMFNENGIKGTLFRDRREDD